MRVAGWLVQVRPREGVLKESLFGLWGKGESPQPVKKFCWWSRARGCGVERVSGVVVVVVVGGGGWGFGVVDFDFDVVETGPVVDVWLFWEWGWLRGAN